MSAAQFRPCIGCRWSHCATVRACYWPGGLNAHQFRAWMEREGWSIAALADALGMSPRQVSYYRSGEQPIPRVVALALQRLSGADAQSIRHYR